MGQAIWETEKYYLSSRKASEVFVDHPGWKVFRGLVGGAGWVVEVGVGEGSKLRDIVGKKGRGVGVDVSLVGLKLASKVGKVRLEAKDQGSKVESEGIQNLGRKKRGLFWVQGDGGRLPFLGGVVDFCYSAFTLEHLEEPEKVVEEMVRVTRKGGYLGFLAPNFGAPNRASPCFCGSRVAKLVKGIIGDWWLCFTKISRSELGWRRVRPRATKEKYEIDWDTVVEPYLLTLVRFLEERGVEVERVSSCWETEAKGSWWQRLFGLLGSWGGYPFKYWGPHLLVVGRKN